MAYAFAKAIEIVFMGMATNGAEADFLSNFSLSVSEELSIPLKDVDS